MITFTKEQLIASTQARIEFAEMMLAGELEPLTERALSIDLELSRRALASLEAEHAGFIVKHKVTGKFGSWLHSKADWFRSDEYEVLSAYTAPPAPVSVPDESAVELLATDLMKRIDKITGERHSVATLSSLRVSIVEACRAAMLQGADGNSPVIPDGWVACSERMPEEDGNYWGWWSESKRQGPVWFIKSELQAQFQSSEITHWMPLPAAPQQEVKP
ncbi:DUF551 domain-containing protein [Enterobacter hormaechei]|uniref:DUF551 domain-containing protein n=1 Tax=Enterobacter hormaechei TaxID=158836 RepID=UPI004044D954